MDIMPLGLRSSLFMDIVVVVIAVEQYCTVKFLCYYKKKTKEKLCARYSNINIAKKFFWWPSIVGSKTTLT